MLPFSRVAGLGQSQAGLIGSSSACKTGLNPTKKNTKKLRPGQILALGPSDPNCFGLRVCWAKHTLITYTFYFASFYFDIWPNVFFFFIKKLQKNLEIFVNLFMSPTYFFMLFFTVYVICDFLPCNMNLICNICFFM